MLSNTPAWTKHYSIQKEWPIDSDGHPLRYNLWDFIPPDDSNSMVNIGAGKFNFHHGITIISVLEGYHEFFGFATHKENESIKNLYFQNIDLLERFICYFHEQTVALLKKLYSNEIFVPSAAIQDDESYLGFPKCPNYKNEFIQATPLNKLPLNINGKKLILSPRESEILKWLLMGKTASEIADILHRSRRTIETHMETLKLKTNSSKKSDMIGKIFQQNARAIQFLTSASRITSKNTIIL